ncbi:type II toxin-antitoxin system VapB family antitoxin [Nonomuraea harbinensis]|uniref:Type II toxin-antitoxin system VapB family antitoxin n=1 Tax=Nonomuraea harbinensis TaxID=1286938 RepID=A0ABW1BQR8_9ACTN|nr:type II toxin-antitoxin system VapB family antitoxin [Nonomuraea harbinensis]
MRTVVDIDKDLLRRAQQELGTDTMKETVHAALTEVAERAKRREAFEYWTSRDNTDLLDPEIRKEAF